MDDGGQGSSKKARNEGTEESQGPRVHVSSLGTPYVELKDLVPYFLPTKEILREEIRSYIKKNKEEIRSYIRKQTPTISANGKDDRSAPPAI